MTMNTMIEYRYIPNQESRVTSLKVSIMIYIYNQKPGSEHIDAYMNIYTQGVQSTARSKLLYGIQDYDNVYADTYMGFHMEMESSQ